MAHPHRQVTPTSPDTQASSNADIVTPNHEVTVENVIFSNNTEYEIAYNHGNLKSLTDKYNISLDPSRQYQFSFLASDHLSNPTSTIETIIHPSGKIEIQIAVGDLVNTVYSNTGHEPRDPVDFQFLGLASTSQIMVALAFTEVIIGRASAEEAEARSNQYAQAVVTNQEAFVAFTFLPQNPPEPIPTSPPLLPETA